MGEWVKLQAADGHQLDAYEVAPEGQARGALLVVQEIFGVNSHIRDVCDRFAKVGFHVLAPAMFDRLQTSVDFAYDAEGVSAGRALKGDSPWDKAALDLEAARQHLSKGEAAGPQGKKLAIIGYCWGGSLAWLGACEGGYAAAIGYYGGQIMELKDREPGCPVLLHFGEKDAGIPLLDVEAIGAAHPGVEIHVYEGADHGFNCDQRSSFDKTSAQLALMRSFAFLDNCLNQG